MHAKVTRQNQGPLAHKQLSSKERAIQLLQQHQGLLNQTNTLATQKPQSPQQLQSLQSPQTQTNSTTLLQLKSKQIVSGHHQSQSHKREASKARQETQRPQMVSDDLLSTSKRRHKRQLSARNEGKEANVTQSSTATNPAEVTGDSQPTQKQKRPTSAANTSSNQSSGSTKNPPMIYQAQHQPSAQQIKLIAQQLKQKSAAAPQQQQVQQQQQTSERPVSPRVQPMECPPTLPMLLPPYQSARDRGKKTLVLDLDETLVHSSFDPVENADIVQGVELDGQTQYVYVLKRPFCEEFIARMSHSYELVMFTASLSQYAEPLYAKLDKARATAHLLFREHCTFYNGLFVKDMARLNRPLSDVIIIDNSPSSYLFQSENALPCISWYEDKSDRELLDFIPLLEKLARVKDVRPYLTQIVEDNQVNLEKAREVLNIGQLMNPEDDFDIPKSPLALYKTPERALSCPRQEESNQLSPPIQQQQAVGQSGPMNRNLMQHSNSVKKLHLHQPLLSGPGSTVGGGSRFTEHGELRSANNQSLQASKQQLQNQIDQVRQQQEIQKQQLKEIEEIKRRVLMHTWTNTNGTNNPQSARARVANPEEQAQTKVSILQELKGQLQTQCNAQFNTQKAPRKEGTPLTPSPQQQPTNESQQQQQPLKPQSQDYPQLSSRGESVGKALAAAGPGSGQASQVDNKENTVNALSMQQSPQQEANPTLNHMKSLQDYMQNEYLKSIAKKPASEASGLHGQGVLFHTNDSEKLRQDPAEPNALYQTEQPGAQAIGPLMGSSQQLPAKRAASAKHHQKPMHISSNGGSSYLTAQSSLKFLKPASFHISLNGHHTHSSHNSASHHHHQNTSKASAGKTQPPSSSTLKSTSRHTSSAAVFKIQQGTPDKSTGAGNNSSGCGGGMRLISQTAHSTPKSHNQLQNSLCKQQLQHNSSLATVLHNSSSQSAKKDLQTSNTLAMTAGSGSNIKHPSELKKNLIHFMKNMDFTQTIIDTSNAAAVATTTTTGACSQAVQQRQHMHQHQQVLSQNSAVQSSQAIDGGDQQQKSMIKFISRFDGSHQVNERQVAASCRGQLTQDPTTHGVSLSQAKAPVGATPEETTRSLKAGHTSTGGGCPNADKTFRSSILTQSSQSSVLTLAQQPSSGPAGSGNGNKNHLQYTSIYAKLSQLNTNFSLSPNSNSSSGGSGSAAHHQGSTNIPIRPTLTSGMAESQDRLSQQPKVSKTLGAACGGQGSLEKQQQQQPKPTLTKSASTNLIAFQMIKSVQNELERRV